MSDYLKTIRTVRLTEPSQEPISLAEAREHLRADGTDADDDLVSLYIKAARDYVEQITGQFWAQATFAIHYSKFPEASYPIKLPFPGVTAVSSITYLDGDYAEQTVSSANYTLNAERRIITASTDWPDVTDTWSYADGSGDTNNYVRVAVTAGPDQTASPQEYVPEAIKAAMYLYIGDMYENRTAGVVGTTIGENKAAMALLYPFREQMGM